MYYVVKRLHNWLKIVKNERRKTNIIDKNWNPLSEI